MYSKITSARAVGVLLASVALTVGAASTASAAATYTSTSTCSTTGGSGSTVATYTDDPYDEVKVTLRVTDTLADGHHVRVRLITKNVSGVSVNWPWHSNTDGANTTVVWSTTAQSGYGIYGQGVQVARFEGETLLNYCTRWGVLD
ncbi:hypothetical protein [Streptomyces sp. NPDC002690]